MPNYIYNRNLDDKGNHEVHSSTCPHTPLTYNQVNIGFYSNCQAAILAARLKTGKSNFDGCYYCCRECHKG